jgi:hypothetical protein
VSAAGTEKLVGDVVTSNYFSALGTRAALGRLFLPDESEAQGASPVVVLSQRLWTRSFNADPRVVGQDVRINRQPMTVVGVAPEGFQGTTIVAVDLWVPMSMVTLVTGSTPEGLAARRAGWLVMGARLKPGATVEQAVADVARIARASWEYPTSSIRSRFVCCRHRRWRTRCRWPPPLILLSAIAATVLVGLRQRGRPAGASVGTTTGWPAPAIGAPCASHQKAAPRTLMLLAAPRCVCSLTDIGARLSAARVAHSRPHLADARLASGAADVRPVAHGRAALRTCAGAARVARRCLDGPQGRIAG